MTLLEIPVAIKFSDKNVKFLCLAHNMTHMGLFHEFYDILLYMEYLMPP